MGTTQEQLALARSAKKSINTASTALKNQALEAMASQLLKATEAILAAKWHAARSLKSCWIAFFWIKSGLQGWHKEFVL